MTSAERMELSKLVRQRGRVAKFDLDAKAAAQLAEVEAQLARQYSVNHEAWKHITSEANDVVHKADEKIAALCRKMNVPESFRPRLNLGWWDRGENSDKKRRAELRAAAEAAIDAQVKAGRAEIERAVVHVCGELVADGLTSSKAKAFLQSLPSVEQLLPPISLPALEQTVMKALIESTEEEE